ncbi:MAG: hypothetical protein KDK01_08010 [Rhodobacteraceae bacterium]|jgi:hypothetical protein|nr:hypothetical protein [Paracoccaceae bacterium]
MFDTSGHKTAASSSALLAVGALATLLTMASPAAAVTEYLGGGFITVSDSCAAFGWTGTHQVNVRLEPQGQIGNSPNETQIAMLLNTGTIAVRLNMNRGVRQVYTPLQAVYVWNGPYMPQEPTMRFAFDPNADWPLTGGPEIERLHVTLENFNEHEGCVGWLYATLVRN